MILSRHGREYYDVLPASDPPLTAWEASFNEGATWTAGTALTGDDAGWFRWLLAGPSVDPGSAIVLSVGSHRVLIRATDIPEIVVREVPAVSVTA